MLESVMAIMGGASNCLILPKLRRSEIAFLPRKRRRRVHLGWPMRRPTSSNQLGVRPEPLRRTASMIQPINFEL
jgi:hypothetical protein